MRDPFRVVAVWDQAASVWCVETSDIPGLNVEAEAFGEFEEVVQDLAPELIRANIPGAGAGPFAVAIEIKHGVLN